MLWMQFWLIIFTIIIYATCSTVYNTINYKVIFYDIKLTVRDASLNPQLNLTE